MSPTLAAHPPLLYYVVFAPVAAAKEAPSAGIKQVASQEVSSTHGPADVLLLAKDGPALSKARDHQPYVVKRHRSRDLLRPRVRGHSLIRKLGSLSTYFT